jgi:hypothetical protein
LGRKIKISSVWTFSFITAIIGAVIIAIFYLPIATKQAEWEKYRQAKICQNVYGCRRIQTAVIIQSQTQSSVFKIPGRLSSATQTNTKYYFQVDLGNNQAEFYVPTRVAIKNDPFDVPNIYIPAAEETTFAEVNFPAGKQIKVEIWDNQVTFIFADFLPWANAHPENGQIAIPTANHPLVILRQTQQDLFGVILSVVVILILVIVLTLRFRKTNWRPDAIIH